MTTTSTSAVPREVEADITGTVTELLLSHVANRGDRLCVRIGGAGRTYSEMQAAAEALWGGLDSVGVVAGDRVAVLLPNRVETVELFFALSAMGAIQVPLNVFLRGEFLRYQLLDSGAATLVTDLDGLTAVERIAADLPSLKRVVVVDPYDQASQQLSGIQLSSYADIRQGPSRPLRGAVVSAGDVLSITYTSGTTGMPKGCLLSHGYYRHVGRAFTSFFELVADDYLYSMLPLYHMGAFCTTLMPSLNVGASAEFTSTVSASRFIPDAGSAGASVVIGVGPMAEAILAGPEDPSTDGAHSLRVAIFAPLQPAAQRAFEKRFGVPVLAEGYGQTECVPITYSTLSAKKIAGSVAPIVPWLDVQVVDDDDIPVAVGATGEIVVRPNIAHAMFLGYWNKPEATVEAWRSLWHHTGDYGRFDEDGLLHFADRKKDAIRRRGENVSSFELESAIQLFPKVAEVAVHAVPSPLGEDDIKACIVPREGASVSKEELFEFFKDNLPYFGIPRYVEFVDRLPRNQVGRVMKHKLRELGVTPSTWDLELSGLTVPRDQRRG